jgi:hypothetical protein
VPNVVQLNIQDNLEAEWRPVLERELNFSLSPVQSRFKNLRIHFLGVVRPAGHGAGYRCILVGRGHGGETYHAQGDSADGRTAIQDALLRARRAVARRRRFGNYAGAQDTAV